ncbi:MAG: hypothetical protein DMG24_21320 [Acidobacteria bacterium]|nr:MAG: hypothetical protein DMG24_21320 [Acidobacteriota bacterium]
MRQSTTPFRPRQNPRSQLGASFPPVTEQLQIHRAEVLSSASRYRDALEEYDALLQARPSSPAARGWEITRARCLVRLKRAREAVEALTAATSNPSDADAERLATLVEAYSQLDDPASMLIVLDQLQKVYPQSPSYRSALFSAGTFFVSKGDWATAARYYQALAAAFPSTDLGREADWRVAWSYYLARDADKARQALVEHVARHPASPHTPAALYWLGRLAEDRGDFSEARALYGLLERRFVGGYYPLQAAARIKALKAKPAARAAEAPTPGQPASSPLAEALDKIPPRDPPRVQLCRQATPSETLGPFLKLASLSLNDPAERYLKAVVSDQPGTNDSILALARFQAEIGKYSDALFNTKKLAPNYFEYEFSELPQPIWEWLYPRAFWNLVQRQARMNRLDPYLVMALIRQESAFNPKATSVANARGLMQMLPSTATVGVPRRRRPGVAQKLYDPAYNIRVASRYLRQVLQAFHGNVEQTLAAYNAGDFRVKDWLGQRSFREPAEFVESIPFRETRLYVETVMRDEVVYRRLMTGAPRFLKCE